MPTNDNHKKTAFLTAFRECGTIRGAARASEVSTRSHYRWLADDAEYADAFGEAGRFAAAHLVDAARERAIEGTRKYRFDRSGQPIVDPRTGEQYFDLAYSDTLLIFLLKGLVPETYGDRQRIQHTADDDWRGKLESQGIDSDQFLDNLREAMERTEQQEQPAVRHVD